MAKQAFLQQVSLFKDLSDRHLHQLESIAEARSFQKNEVICRLQEPGSSLYVVIEGTVKVGMQVRNGKENLLYIVRADRVVAAFQRAGLVRIKKRRMAVINPARLKREATRSWQV